MNKAEQRREQCRQRIAGQGTSGQSIRAYCRERGLQEHAFNWWRRRLREQSAPVRFALVETKQVGESHPPIELMLVSESYFYDFQNRRVWDWGHLGEQLSEVSRKDLSVLLLAEYSAQPEVA